MQLLQTMPVKSSVNLKLNALRLVWRIHSLPAFAYIATLCLSTGIKDTSLECQISNFLTTIRQKVMIFNVILFYLVVFLPDRTALAGTCESWFLKSEVKAGTKTCELDCSVIPTNMGTFNCGSQCDKLCKTIIDPDTMAKIARYIEPRALTPVERSLIAKYPIDALRVYQAKRAATDSTKRIFNGNFRNDESDAYRHFLWSGLIREHISHDVTGAFLNAHEADTGEPEAESLMDKSNNEKGIAAAEKLMEQRNFSQKNLEKQAIQALTHNDLNVLSPTRKVPEWKK